MSDAISSAKLEQGKYFGTADAVWVPGYLRFEPGAWKWNEGLPCLCADCKILIPPTLITFSHSILYWTVLSWNLEGVFETFLEGSVDHIIYRDYIVNQRFFIYCSLATVLPPGHTEELTLDWQCCPLDTHRGANPWLTVLPLGHTCRGTNPWLTRAAPWTQRGELNLDWQCYPLDPTKQKH